MNPFLSKPIRSLFWAVLLLIASVACSPFQRSDVEICDLKVDSQTGNIVTGTANPVFSWRLRSAENDRYQTAFHLIVENEETGEKVWDSGEVRSDNNIRVAYSGKPLLPVTRYSWKVRIFDNREKASRWTEPARFTTGLLSEEDWKARWIGSPDSVYSPLFVKEFDLRELPREALVFVNSLGYYELYVNGHKVGNDVLSPAVSDFRFENYYLTYSIRDYLKAGKNSIGLWTGQCWYSPGLPGVSHHSPVIRCQAHLRIGNEELILGTDTSWNTANSNLRQIGIWRWNQMGGELVDGRESMTDWPASVLRSTKKVIEVEAPAAETRAQICPVNYISDTIPVTSITKIADQVWLADFGKNFSGWMEIKIKGQDPGDTILFHYSDFCNRIPEKRPNGTWDFGNAYIDQRDAYICPDRGTGTFRPKFNYHAFRYVVIEGADLAPDPEDLTGYMIESELEKNGNFTCSDPDLNAISELNAFTFRCLNAGGYYVDCPHRERLGYGDGQVAVETGIFNYGLENYYKKWATNWLHAQKESGEFPNTAPSPYDAGGGPGWGGTAVVLPWKIFTYYADTAFLAAAYPKMAAYTGFLETHFTDGLLSHYGDPVWGFIGDWVAPGRGMDVSNPVGAEEKGLFNNCYLLYLYDILAKTADVTDQLADREEFLKKKQRLTRRIHETYYHPERGIYANGEQSYLCFPLLTGVAADSTAVRVLANLVNEIEVTNQGHLNTGMLGTYFLLQYLTGIGRSDLVHLMMKQKTYPGWGYMIEQGANTCWEQWNGYWSNIHSCFTSGGGWFYTGVAGFGQRESSTAFKQLVLRPQLIDKIDRADAWFLSPYGKVVLSWSHTKTGQVLLHVEIPVNCQADLILPPDLSAEVLSLKSGTYDFTYPTPAPTF